MKPKKLIHQYSMAELRSLLRLGEIEQRTFDLETMQRKREQTAIKEGEKGHWLNGHPQREAIAWKKFAPL